MGDLFVKVGLFSLAKPFAVAMAFVGFIIGSLYLVGGIIYDIFITRTVNMSTALKFFALLPLRLSVLIIMPLAFATFGFVVGMIGAFLNNLVVGWLG